MGLSAAASSGRPTGSLRSRRPPSRPAGTINHSLKSVTYVPGLKCYPCPRPYRAYRRNPFRVLVNDS